MTKNFFAYGTLMCEDIMVAVTGRSFRHIPGTLHRYQRRAIQGEVYPGLVAKKGGVVEGITYLNLPDETWAQLDTFEGKMYQRKMVNADLMNGTSVEAYTYVVRREFKNRVKPVDWDYWEFLRTGKKRFEAEYAGFRVLGNIK